MNAAVVELDPLADPVGAGPQDHHRGPVAAFDLVGRPVVPARVEIGRSRLEFGGTGVDRPEGALAGKGSFGVERQVAELFEEPAVDGRPLVSLVHVQPGGEAGHQAVEAVGAGDLEAVDELFR